MPYDPTTYTINGPTPQDLLDNISSWIAYGTKDSAKLGAFNHNIEAEWKLTFLPTHTPPEAHRGGISRGVCELNISGGHPRSTTPWACYFIVQDSLIAFGGVYNSQIYRCALPGVMKVHAPNVFVVNRNNFLLWRELVNIVWKIPPAVFTNVSGGGLRTLSSTNEREMYHQLCEALNDSQTTNLLLGTPKPKVISLLPTISTLWSEPHASEILKLYETR